jgi:hypothetical protein
MLYFTTHYTTLHYTTSLSVGMRAQLAALSAEQEAIAGVVGSNESHLTHSLARFDMLSQKTGV